MADDEGAACGKEFDKWEVSELPGPEPGETATGTGGWPWPRFSKDPEKVAACVDIMRTIYVGAGNELTGELPTSQKAFDTLKAFQQPIFQAVPRLPRARAAAPGPRRSIPSLSNEMQIAIGSRPDRLLDARGGARHRGRAGRADLRAAERERDGAHRQLRRRRAQRVARDADRALAASRSRLTWLAPLLAVATLFFLWPVLNVIRLAFTNTTLLRDGYSYTLQTFAQTLADPALPKVLGRHRDLRRRARSPASCCSAWRSR